MALTHLQAVSVPVSDQTRAKDFYVDVLGFDLLADNPMDAERRWVQVAPKGAVTSLTLVTWFPTMPAGSLKGLVLVTDDIRADERRLKERGVRFGGPIQEEMWGRYLEFDDPDGNAWVLVQPPATGR